MAITIGTLLVRIKAEIAEFISGMTKAEQQTTKTAAAMKRELKQQSREAKDSLDLLANSAGVHLPRELKKALSGFEGLRQIASAALPVAGILGFASVIATILVPKIQKLIDEYGGLSEAQKKTLEIEQKSNDKIIEGLKDIKKLREEIALIGLSPVEAAKLKVEFRRGDQEALQRDIDALNERAAAEQRELDRLDKLRRAGGVGFGATDEQKQKLAETLAAINELNIGLNKAHLEGVKAGKEGAEAFAQLKQEIVDVDQALLLLSDAEVDRAISSLGDQAQRVAEVLAATGKEALAYDANLNKLADQITQVNLTAQEQFIIQEQLLEQLHELGKITDETYGRALDSARKKLETTIAKTKEADDAMEGMKRTSEDLAHAVGTAFEDAVVNLRSVRDVLVGLLQDIARIFLRIAVTKPLENLFGNLLGGFSLGSIFGGGRAMGGPVSAGTSYLVGEKGPELFTPNTSGSISPGTAGTILNYYISAGLSPDQEMRWGRLLKEVHKDSQVQAIRRVREESLRR